MMSEESAWNVPAIRVLVVDDEPAILRLMQYVLDRHGYDVRMATDGDEALEVVTAFLPDLVILDIMMPRKDGYAVTEAIRADPNLAHIPIVMLSAKAQEADVALGLALGVNIYLTKPFEPDALLEAVAQCLRANRPGGT